MKQYPDKRIISSRYSLKNRLKYQEKCLGPIVISDKKNYYKRIFLRFVSFLSFLCFVWWIGRVKAVEKL